MKKCQFLFLLCSPVFLFAQERLKTELLDSVVIDTKTRISTRNSGKVVTTIDAEKIEQSPGSSVADLINEVAGIEINGVNSYEGQNLSYFVRGGNNRQVVIMVDGVQLNDASQIANDYDLRLIPIGSVESIEILKGASSVLYGSGAGTAVINITTKTASKESLSGTFSSMLGTNNAANDANYDIETISNYAQIGGYGGGISYMAEFSNRYANGLSAIASREGEPAFEPDVFNRYNGKVNLGIKLSEKVRFSQFFSFDKYKSGFDDFSYTDADHQTVTDQLKTGGRFTWTYRKGTFVFNDSYTVIDREIMSDFPARFESKSYTFDAYLDHRISERFRALLGLNGNFSNFSSFNVPFGANNFVQQLNSEETKFSLMDPYLNLVYLSTFGLNLNAGLRINFHSDYGTHMVYNFNPSYTFDFGNNTLKLLGTYSTAFITPSLFQLYDPQFGNRELKPEENRTIEAGLVYKHSGKVEFSVVYFQREENNFVDFVTVDPDLFIFQYRNTDLNFQSNGVELTTDLRLTDRFQLNANYTFTMADDRFSLRIPAHKINTALRYRCGKKTAIALKYQFVSKREDNFFNPITFQSETVTLHSYDLLGFYISSEVNKNITLFGAITNLLDESYEELYRYQTKGRNVNLGFKLTL